MDSLLGIGIAGGGTSKGEGKALASRLSEMRKESNERAKAKSVTKKKEQPSSPMMGMGGSGPAGQMALQGLDSIGGDAPNLDMDMSEMEIVTPNGGSGGSSKKKNNKKKKKKRKKKN